MDEEKSSEKRKYNSNFRKKILNKIKLIKNKNDLVSIFKIVNRDIGDNFSQNKSGIFFNMNLLSDEGIEEILKLIDLTNASETATENTEEKLIYKTYSENEIEVYNSIGGSRLSNQEKSILKKLKNLN
jgi:hypothetical protein|tara:strand:- start:1052 stop:1435 length:384 start_codon:yes stop_codon:yes gene_type:complete